MESMWLSQKAGNRSSLKTANCSVLNFICVRNDLTENESGGPQALCNKIQTIQLADKYLPFQSMSYQYTIKVKVKFSLEQATKAQSGSRGIAVLFL